MSHEASRFREPVVADDRAPEERAHGFASARQAHQSEMAQDYVEMIADLIETEGEARPVDLAERLGVRPPTVTKNLSRLEATGLVRHERYRSIFLTGEGQALAESCRHRHRVVVAFLRSLGIDEETAERDAEGIEHHVSDKTLAAFQRAIGERS